MFKNYNIYENTMKKICVITVDIIKNVLKNIYIVGYSKYNGK